MKNLKLRLIAGILFPAFFMATPLSAQPADNCAQETKESNIKQGIEEAPMLLITTLENAKLNSFWERLRGFGLMGGTIDIDKVYIFSSEHHPTLVYVYFLNGGCIVDVRFTLKTIVMAALE
jgi:hypothetical protein